MTASLRAALLAGIRAFEQGPPRPLRGPTALETEGKTRGVPPGGHSGSQFSGVGRPFLVAGAPRLASFEERGDWAEPIELDLTWLDGWQREELGVRWTKAALMEHASVAAFARFSLQLLGAGAPWNLVRRSQRAMAEELAHAEACFGVASCFLGRPIGPGPLPLDGAELALPLGEMVRAAFLEGCIGETVAALEAEWASQRVADRALQSLLAGIAQEERAHAELAWRLVTWASVEDPTLEVVLVELGRAALADVPRDFDARRDSGVGPAAADQWLIDFGIVPDEIRDEIRTHALIDVVAPCLARVLGGRGRPPVVAA